MKQWIGLVVLSVFALDAIVAWYLGLYPQALVLTVLLTPIGYLWCRNVFNKQVASSAKSGWSLGQGVDLSDPDNPKTCEVLLEESMLNKGILAFGSPGFGKSTTLLIGYLHYLSTHHPETGWLAADGKGDLDMYAYLTATGVKPDYFFSTLAPSSDTINVLGSSDPYEATEIAVALLLDTERSGDSVFYQEAEENHLRSAIPILKDRELLGGPVLTLRELLAFTIDSRCAEQVLLEAMQRNDRVELITKLRYWHCLKPKDRLGPLKGLVQRLEILAISPRSERWNDPTPSLELEQAINQGEKIFLHLPFSPMAKKLSIAITQLMLFVANRRQITGGKQAKLFATLWEDWGGFMHSDWANIVSRTRSANMSASFSFQSLDQVDVVRISKQLDDSILTKFIFSVDGVDSAKRCAEMMGTYESVQVSLNDRTGKRYDGTNTSMTRKPRIHEEDIWRLSKGEGFLITRSTDTEGHVQKRYFRIRPKRVEPQTEVDLITWPVIKHETHLGSGLWQDLIRRKTIANQIAAEQGILLQSEPAGLQKSSSEDENKKTAKATQTCSSARNPVTKNSQPSRLAPEDC